MNTAHFGMTLLMRASMRWKPLPDAVVCRRAGQGDGSYRTLGAHRPRYLVPWHRWKDAGNSLYVDPLCSIGHLQVMCSAFSDELKVEHLHLTEWREKHWPGTRARVEAEKAQASA